MVEPPTIDLDALARLGTTLTVPRAHVLLREGDVAEHVFFVRTGALRTFTTPKGRDVTFQFFFEGEGVASFESFHSGTPSRFSVQAIEPSTVIRLSRETVERLTAKGGVASDVLREHFARRLTFYMRRVESLITEPAVERYQRLRTESPEVVARVHQHYLASYLGITPVSLSRLRRQLAR